MRPLCVSTVYRLMLSLVATSLLLLPFREQLKNFALPGGQQLIAVDRSLLFKGADVVFGEYAADLRAEVGLAL